MSKTYLITGGTGSLGQELVKQLIDYQDCSKIIVYSRSEQLQQEMKRFIQDPAKKVRYIIGDVRDKEQLNRSFKDVDIVIHAAALKHMDVCGYNPTECIKTNIIGTMNVVNAAVDCGVWKVLSISTDKAVNPNCIYGAAKLVGDYLVTESQVYGNTKFAVFRSGNFKGSSGSVVPYFEKLKEQGATELPITDFKMTRFFIELKDVAAACLHAINNMSGGEIFVPKMKPVRITELAKEIHPEAEQKEIGMRPGEKLHEEIFTVSDTKFIRETDNFYIYKHGQVGNLPEGIVCSSSGIE